MTRGEGDPLSKFGVGVGRAGIPPSFFGEGVGIPPLTFWTGG